MKGRVDSAIGSNIPFLIYRTSKGIINEVLPNIVKRGKLALSNNYTSGNGANNGNSFASRRERTGSLTGALPPITTGTERAYGSSSGFDFEQMIQSLREVFEQDRQIASQPDSTRCGICYLHFPVSELHYRDEGFYICEGCQQGLGKQSMPMLRQQQKL